MELSKKQQEIVEATEPYIVINSCAGSGKTRTLSERVKFLLLRGVPANKIVVITFTNAAAETAMERIGNAPGLNCCTVHAYANRLLLMAGVDTSKILNDEDFDKLFMLVKQHPECIQEVEYLLLDEGQDSTSQQFEFMLDMVKPKNWMIFCDHRQSIYGFAGANPEHIIDLIHDPSVTVYDLDENYRNSPEILDYAQSLICKLGYDYEDFSVPMRKNIRGRVVNVDYSGEGIVTTIKRYVEQGRALYSDWFILTRTNAESEDIMKVLARHKIPYDTFKKAQLNSKGLEAKMKENTVKVLTIHTAKGLEAENVIVIGARWHDAEECRINYVAATRAKNLLVWTIKRAARKPSKIKTEHWGG